jgi:hypothetical protein
MEREEFDFILKIKNKFIKDHLGKFKVHGKNIFYSKTSLWMFDSKNRFR